MPKVETKIFIEDVDDKVVWDILVNFEAYPRIMTDVLSVGCFNKNDTGFDSEWRVLLNGSELSWIERDDVIPNRKIVFNQIEGDLENWEGYYEIVQEECGVWVTLVVYFDLGIPSLEEILNPIGINAIRSNSLQILNAIKAQSQTVKYG